ncbi:MAG: hypothetical protein ACOCQA_02475 [bacterium]
MVWHRKIFYKKIIILIILISILIAGCATNEDMDNESKEVNFDKEKLLAYFPVLPGMHYEYRGEGIEYAAFIRDIKYVEKPFVQIHDNNGGTIVATIYKVKEDRISIISQQEEFYSEDNLLLKLDKDVKEKEIILKTPLQEGNSWESNDKRKEIIKTGMTLELPAGKFYDVIKVESKLTNRENELTNYYYYAKNIGLVKEESKGENFNVISELKAYKNTEADG